MISIRPAPPSRPGENCLFLSLDYTSKRTSLVQIDLTGGFFCAISFDPVCSIAAGPQAERLSDGSYLYLYNIDNAKNCQSASCGQWHHIIHLTAPYSMCYRIIVQHLTTNMAKRHSALNRWPELFIGRSKAHAVSTVRQTRAVPPVVTAVARLVG